MSEAESSTEDGIAALLGIIESLRSELVANEDRSRVATADTLRARAEAQALRDRIAASERDLQELRSVRAELTRRNRPGLWRRLALASTPML